jgi:mannose-6-phosphate isomerase
VKPLALPPNQQHHFYLGGAGIAALRGQPPLADERLPEDWVGAVSTMFGSDRGLSRLEDGRLLRDVIAADPEAFLGAAHVARYGASTELLVKLLDAGERLPVHFHPGRDFARAELGLDHGKTEAWLIVATEQSDAAVHIGFREAIDEDTVRAWMRDQDAEAMLAAMHRAPVAPGDAIFVPAGTPHAIGAGILMVELQEPADLSILLEWEGFALDGEAEGHLGLGYDTALRALDRSAWSEDRLAALRGSREQRVLPADADPYFRAEWLHAPAELDVGFSILVALNGEGSLVTQDDHERSIRRGDTVLIPFNAGVCALHGDVEAIRCRPPA